MAFGFWLLAFGFWLLAFGFWLLSFGFWLLAFGFWLLAFGFWLLAAYDTVRSVAKDFIVMLSGRSRGSDEGSRNIPIELPGIFAWIVTPQHLGGQLPCNLARKFGHISQLE